MASIQVADIPATDPSMRGQALGSGEAKKPSLTSGPARTASQSSGISARTSPAVTSENGLGERWIVSGLDDERRGTPDLAAACGGQSQHEPGEHSSQYRSSPERRITPVPRPRQGNRSRANG